MLELPPIPEDHPMFHVSPEDDEFDFIWLGPNKLKAYNDLRTCSPEIRHVAACVAERCWRRRAQEFPYTDAIEHARAWAEWGSLEEEK